MTQESGNTIHAALFKFKNKNKRVFRLIFGTAADNEIFENILHKLDRKFEILMIHSSFDGMLPMYTGNLSKLLSLIISYCKQNNITLAMPTFFGGTNLQAKEYYEKGNQIFNVKKTASQIGLLTEIFRTTKNVKRSIHPTHSISAVGPLADQLIKNHHLADTTFGEGTPFYEMIKYKTVILGIGTKSDQALTQIHSVEDIMKGNYPIQLYSDILPVTCIDEFGNKLQYNLRIKNPEYVIDRKSFYRILKRIKILEWTYKGIPFFLTQADAVTKAFVDAAKNGQTMYKKRK